MRIFGICAAASVALLTIGCATAPESTTTVTIESPEAAAADFLAAFNALDASRFDASFAEDVTMFFPDGPFPQGRVEGKQAVTAAFHSFFAMAKERGATRLNIQPLDMKVQNYGAFAVASFHLRGNGNIGRRSLVLRREGSEWRIVHFHASSLEERR